MTQSIIRWLASLLICLGVALAGYGGWTLISGEVFQASSVIRYEFRSSDMGPPGFLHTSEFARFITSDAVLSAVVKKLELDQPATAGTLAKSVPASCEQLRRQVVVTPVHNTMNVKITVRDASPAQAAKLANTIAEVYRDSWLENIKRQAEADMRTLEERLAQSLSETKKASDLLARRQAELKVSYPEQMGWSNRLQLATNTLPDDRARELRLFDEARRDFENRMAFQRKLEQRLAMEKVDQTLPRSGVTVTDRAAPPKSPRFPSRTQSLTLLFFGVLLAGMGGFLFRRNRGTAAE